MKGKNLIARALMLTVAIFLFAGCGKDNFIVTFDSANGTKNTREVTEGKQATKPANPTRDGYEFLGWFIGDVEYDFTKPVDKDVTITAKWKKIETGDEIKKYTVSFNADGGSAVTNQTVEENKIVVKPTNPTKEGYTFAYWKLDNQEYDFNSKVTKNITLTAVWTKKDEVVNKPTNPTKPTNPAKPTNPTNPSKPTNPTTPEQPKPTMYTVSFNSDGGSAVASQSIEKGKTASKPANPTRSGYTFNGWYLNGSAYNFGTAIAGNITLTASWTKDVVEDKYTAKVFLYNNDQNSTERIIKVYKNGTEITGTTLYDGSKTLGVYKADVSGFRVNYAQYNSATNLKVKLSDGKIYDIR